MNAPPRTWVVRLHRWTGLTLGLVLVFMAVTGAFIAYRPHLEPIVNRELLTAPACTPMLPLDTLTRSARAAHPEGELDYIRIAAGEAGAARVPSVQIRFHEPGIQEDVFLDPCSGAVLGQRLRYDGMLGTFESLHRFRFMEGGNLVTGTTAIAFILVLAAGGIFLWWPRRGRPFAAALRTHPRLDPRVRGLDRHKVVGLYASLIVALSALTGLPQAFDWYRNGVYRIAGSPPPEKPPKSAATAGATPLPMEAFWQKAQSLVPQPRETLLHYPAKKGEAVEIFMIGPDAPHANARTLLFLDAYSGSVLRFTPYAESSAGHKFYFWTISWHTGQIGGLFGPLLLLAGALSVPYLGYTGIGSYVRRRLRTAPAGARLEVQVARKEKEAADICVFELADPHGQALPNFGAGSHIDVHVRPGITRQYSLCNDPKETHRYLIGVLRVADSRGGSSAMHDDVQEGDLIEIGEPRNHFPLAHAARRSLLVAGGIGVTPILCMAERLSNIGADFEMHYCARSPERTAFRERIRASAFAPRVSLHFDDGPAGQRFDAAAILRSPDPGTHLYVCGPTGFMDFVIAAARAAGWAEPNIHREYFSAPAQRTDNDRAFDVKIASTGKVYRVPGDETVVATLKRHGIDIPTSCEQGVCGTCLTRVIEGEPDHRDLFQSAEERARNDRFTPCCSRSKGEMLVVDL